MQLERFFSSSSILKRCSLCNSSCRNVPREVIFRFRKSPKNSLLRRRQNRNRRCKHGILRKILGPDKSWIYIGAFGKVHGIFLQEFRRARCRWLTTLRNRRKGFGILYGLLQSSRAFRELAERATESA